MEDLLRQWQSLPLRKLAAEEALIEEGVATGNLYIVRDGSFRVERDGVTFVRCREPGAFLGEISALLGSTPTATVIAEEPGSVYVWENAQEAVQHDAQLTLAIARLLARRLASMTTYITDLRQQYADSGTHLGMMDQVLTSLMSGQGRRAELGSERNDLPDY